MRTLTHKVDLCVVGGGMAGLCCAIAAARRGATVVLMQDRPVLGGNASSEIRMHIGGARGVDDREGGIIEELECENYYINTGLKYPIWDSVLYGAAMAEEKLTLLLNTSCLDAGVEDGRIRWVKGWQLNAETFHTVEAAYFADCSGDSILAPLTGAAFMLGREGKAEYNESIAPDLPDRRTMGMSCLLQAVETDSPKPFIKPEWAYTYETDEELPHSHPPRTSFAKFNFWWMEVGGMADSIHDTDECRHELIKIAYGVWDHIKNKGDHGAENWELDWIGFLPGKRESRRYVGKYIINENDVRARGPFEDIVAYGGWPMDDHFPEGFYYKGKCSTIWHKAPSPWGIPFRALCHRDIENLLFAGRNISVTHVALASSRVMATCAILGQAVGTAVAQMTKDGTTPDTIDIPRLQATLMEDDCFLPGLTRRISPLSASAHISHEVLRDGVDRGKEHLWIGKAGDSAAYTFDAPTYVSRVRLVFDSDLDRNFWNMPQNYAKDETRFRLSPLMIRDFDLVLTYPDGTERRREYRENRRRLVYAEIGETVSSIRLEPKRTFGAEELHVFDFEVIA